VLICFLIAAAMLTLYDQYGLKSGAVTCAVHRMIESRNCNGSII